MKTFKVEVLDHKSQNIECIHANNKMFLSCPQHLMKTVLKPFNLLVEGISSQHRVLA